MLAVILAEAATQVATQETSTLVQVLSIIGGILSALAPIALVIIAILARKGKISKETAKDAETVIGVITDSVEKFKGVNKDASKELTSIISTKASAENVSENLENYLGKFGLNKPNGA